MIYLIINATAPSESSDEQIRTADTTGMNRML